MGKYILLGKTTSENTAAEATTVTTSSPKAIDARSE